MSGGPGVGIPSPYSNLLGQNSQLSQHAHQQLLNWQPGQPIQILAGQMPTWQQMSTGPQGMTTGYRISQAGQSAQSQPALKPDPKQPDTLGWREWKWSETDKRLKSPSQDTLWPEAELVVPNWDEGDAVRGTSGIHAHLVPKHWKILASQHCEYARGPLRVHGIVERFGKYVLGTEGWRAEWVVIKELMAPSTEVGLALEQAYPDVIVHYPEEEGDESCTLEKSSKLGKGRRPTNRPKPSPSPSQLTQSAAHSLALSQMQMIQQAQILQMQALQNANPPTPSQQMHPLDIGQSQPSPLDDPHLKLGAIVFWGMIALVVVCLGSLLS